MACTTILVGKKASYDGSTMMARNDDGGFDTKKLIVVEPDKQPKQYKTVISHLTIDLPDNPMRYTCIPNVNKERGVWPAMGINQANVAMTATETITSNPRVMGADPMVVYQKATKKGEKDIPGGIGEEDLVLLVLPYVKTAREGVLRLGALLEQYGTYEANGIGISDENEIWWLETIGGHHWIATKVPDDRYVLMPNQFGTDHFDMEDALGTKENNLCSADLKEFIAIHHLDCNQNGQCNPRLIFGSHTTSDHVYNTPRGWYMARYFNPRTYKWDGDNADFTPESDDIPFSLVPERKITVDEVKYILSSHYQGTPYDPYAKADNPKKGIYRPIGINRTDDMAILQIRPYAPEAAKGVEWVCFGANSFNAVFPVYTNVPKMPSYLSRVTEDVSTNNFFWCSRLLGALADPHFGATIQMVERYQWAMLNEGHRLLEEYDKQVTDSDTDQVLNKANIALCQMAQELTTKALNRITHTALSLMKCGYSRQDN